MTRDKRERFYGVTDMRLFQEYVIPACIGAAAWAAILYVVFGSY